jgi:hypothetical protein
MAISILRIRFLAFLFCQELDFELLLTLSYGLTLGYRTGRAKIRYRFTSSRNSSL